MSAIKIRYQEQTLADTEVSEQLSRWFTVPRQTGDMSVTVLFEPIHCTESHI
jgi:hypothetical protein